MKLTQLLVALPLPLIVLWSGTANAGPNYQRCRGPRLRERKWDEKEVEKGHKVVDYAGRCVKVPDDPAAPKATSDCVGKYEYMPDGS